MTQINIKGIDIQFPYVPYDVQISYMTKVIECLQQGVNGLLESPTGTGKTLSLLCSVLAWLETRKAQHQLLVLQHSANDELGNGLTDLRSQVDNAAGLWNSDASSFMLPQIIYSSRTHTQLSQAIQELKRCSYKYVTSAVLGSRDQLCVHPEVSKMPAGAAKHYACRTKVGNKSCPFHLNYEEKLMSLQLNKESTVIDIEDLVVLGKKNTFCPYYAARTLRNKADIVFTPYNYVIDPKTRRAQGIELQNNVVIVDEAHNIDSVCEDSMSIQLRSVDLAMCINELSQTINLIKDSDNDQSSFSSTLEAPALDFTLNDVLSLKVMLCELESAIDSDMAECSSASGLTKPGDYMLNTLTKVELSPERGEVVVELLEKITQYHTNAGAGNPWGPKAAGLQKLADLLKTFYSRHSSGRSLDLAKDLAKKYRTHLQIVTPNKGKNAKDPWAVTHSNSGKTSWQVDCWCFSPEIGMQDVMAHGVHSILLTSGTLSPLPPLASELGISFPVQLENPHIISDKQVLVAVASQGPDGTLLNSSYQNRFSEKYISSIGRCITNLCRMIPNGVLVFFPSYSVMKGNIDKWAETGIWQSLSGVKPVYVEPQGKDAFQQSMEQFYNSVNDPQSKGAALLGVCRGKVSEGLDFSDDNARGVIITGLPFPPSQDPKVKLKMAYLDSIFKETKGLRGNEWYCLQASRAVNQAIGRVIRHKDDYGAILLCDNRFAEMRMQKQLSKWVQGRIKVFSSFGPIFKQVSTFFKEINPNPTKPSNQRVIGGFVTTSQAAFGNGMKASVASCSNAKNTADCNKKADCDDQSLFASYKGTETNCEAAPVPPQVNATNSIFDAFDQCDVTGDQDTLPSKASDVSYRNRLENMPGTSTGGSTAAKRRKINIEFRRADQQEKDKAESKADDREMWKKYLKEVKMQLTSPILYSKFCSLVKEYKTVKNTTKFAAEMKEIFSDSLDKKNFLKRTSLLVTPQERNKFLDICL